MFYSLNDGFGFYQVHTGKVTSSAAAVAVDAARAAVEVGLYDILSLLLPAHEAGEGMGGAPDADHRSSRERGQVHIGRVHREHDIKVANEDKLLVHILQVPADVDALWQVAAPLAEQLVLCPSTSEEEDAGTGMFLK